MSDTPQGEGWWQASDNKWYPPTDKPAPPLPPPPTSGQAAEPAKQEMPAGCGFGLVACLAIAVIAVIAGALNGDDSSGSSGGGASDFGAKDVCHQAVDDQLRAPATSDFGGETVTHVGNEYTVIGHVDAENGFGANIRTEFICTATFVSGTRWNPVSAVLLE